MAGKTSGSVKKLRRVPSPKRRSPRSDASHVKTHDRHRAPRNSGCKRTPSIRVDSCPSVVSSSRSSFETLHDVSVALEPRSVIRGSKQIGGLNPQLFTCDSLRPSIRLAAKGPVRRIRRLDGKTGAAPLRIRAIRAIFGYNPRSGLLGSPAISFPSWSAAGGRGYTKPDSSVFIRVHPWLQLAERFRASLTTHHSGSANATMIPPEGRPDFPPPAEITTYWRPATS